MCYGCWDEEGRPEILTLEVGRLAWLATMVDDYGAFHIVKDDWNVEDDNINFCLAQTDPPPTEIEALFGRLMLEVPLEARTSALAMESGFWGVQRIPSPH